MKDIERPKILYSINPANVGTGEETLRYDELEGNAMKYMAHDAARFGEFCEAEQGSFDELSAAKKLAAQYLIATANKAVNTSEDNHDLWAQRFTQASIEFYGRPDPDEVTKITNGENREQLEAIQPFISYVREAYQPLFDLVDETGKDSFEPQDIREIFDQAIDLLAGQESPDQWSQWRAVDSNSAGIIVDTDNKIIKVPSSRAPATASQLKGLIAHEILVHARRSVNGAQSDIKKLDSGLSGYLAFEEGFAVTMTIAGSGSYPQKIADKYVDIALALEDVGGRQRTRQELHSICYQRELARAGNNANTSQLSETAWRDIDRIYRGGKGNNQGNYQAIFTKDIVYYDGFLLAQKYIADQLQTGVSPQEIFDYLSLGKFDPTNNTHAEIVRNTQD